MSTQTTQATASQLEQAREALTAAEAAHAEAREASDSARATLAKLEAAADRGEHVDVAAYTTAKSDLGLKARRTSALAAKVTDAQQAVADAEKAEEVAKLHAQAAAIPDPTKARDAAVKAVEKYLDAVRAQADATAALYSAARVLPEIEHPAPAGKDGWPAYTTRYGGGRVELKGKIGHLILNGQRINRPHVPDAAERLSEEVRRAGDRYRRY